jgi:hypothetical protein
MPGEYFFASTQHSWIDWTGRAYLLLRAYGEGPKPVGEAELWDQLAGRYLFDTGQFGVLRTGKSISSFSWGRQVMGLVMPLQSDLLLNPSERSLIGRVAVKGVDKERPKVKRTIVSEEGDALSVYGLLERAGGKIEQRFHFLALPGDRTLYVEQIRPTAADVEIERLELGLLSVLNDANWVYHDGVRTVYHENGKNDFESSGPEAVEPVALSSKWHNLDDALGVVCLLGSGKQTYLPNHKPVRGRTEQSFCLNLVESATTSSIEKAATPENKTGGKKDAIAPIAETALLFYPGQKHDATRAAAGKVKCERLDPGDRYRITLEDGKGLDVDFAILKAKTN